MSAVQSPNDVIMKDVTNQSICRNIDTKVSGRSIPSIYQLIYYKFMKKIAYIGIPIVVIVLIAVVALNRSNTKVAYQGTDSGTITGEEQASSQGQTFTKDSSIDSIAASFDADADTDGTNASAESEDDQTMQQDLQNYNDLKTYDYENN